MTSARAALSPADGRVAAPLGGGGASARSAIAALVLVLSTAARAAPIELSWDKELAFDYDREHYGREVQALVEQSYATASSELGITVQRSIRVNVMTPAQYERTFGPAAAFHQGARYSRGAIHVNGGSRFTDVFAGLLVHEMTHAVLDHRGTGNRLPLWLNEGLAERLGWKRKGLEDLTPDQRETLMADGREKKLTPLPAWGNVTFTYLQCYGAVLYFEKKAGKDAMLAVVRRTLDGEPFERALDTVMRWTVDDLNRGFANWVEHL